MKESAITAVLKALSAHLLECHNHSLSLPSRLLIESRPTPEISWTKVSGVLPAKRTSFLHYQRTLRIVNVSESDAGDYRCTGRNPLGSVHHTIHVTVKGASVMSCTESHQAVRSPCGDRVTPSACLFILPPSHN